MLKKYLYCSNKRSAERKFNLSAEFFIGWFINLGKYVENDLCSYKFYNGIAPFTKNNKNALDSGSDDVSN